MTPSFVSVHPGGRIVRYKKVGRRWERAGTPSSRKNPITFKETITGTDLLLIAGGVVALGAVGYFLWVTMQDSAAASSAGDATAGGAENADTILGSAGGSQILGPGASTSGTEPPPPIQIKPPVTRAPPEFPT